MDYKNPARRALMRYLRQPTNQSNSQPAKHLQTLQTCDLHGSNVFLFISLFDSLPIFIHDIAISCLRSAVFQKLEDVANDVHTTEQIRPAIDMVSSLMENFKIGNCILSINI